jgi:hypothetical protein
MRTHLLLTVLLSGVALGAAGRAGAAPAAVAELIGRLGSPKFEEREQAGRDLEAAGPVALDELRRALTSDDPEVRHRADVLVRRLEAQALARKVLAPTRVRLVYRGEPIEQAVHDLQQKTGAQVVLQDPGRRLADRRLTLDTGDTTLWEALDRFCGKAGLTEPYLEDQTQAALARRDQADGLGPAGLNVQQARIAQLQAQILMQRQMQMQLQMQLANGGPGTRHVAVQGGPIVLSDGKRPPLPTYYAGAVRVRALPPEGPAAAVPRRSSEAAVVLEATPEPRLPWHGITGVHIDRALDDQGQHLARVWEAPAPEVAALPPGALPVARLRVRGGMPMAGPPTTGAQQQPVVFKRGEKPSKVLKELSGTILAEVETEPEAILTVDKVLQAVGQTVRAKEGGWLRVTQAEKVEGATVLIRCELEVPPDVIPATLSPRSTGRGRRPAALGAPAATAVNGLQLLDEDGNPMPMYTRHTQGRVNGATLVWDCAFATGGGAEPAKLVFVGSRVAPVAIPFTLTDVPLP